MENIHYSKWRWITKGTKPTCLNDTNYKLTAGNEYRAFRDAEEGIFSTRPLVTVIDDTGEQVVCHLSRFARTDVL